MEYYIIGNKCIPKKIVIIEWLSQYLTYYKCLIGQTLSLEMVDRSPDQENPMFYFDYLNKEGNKMTDSNIFLNELENWCKYLPADRYEKLRAFI